MLLIAYIQTAVIVVVIIIAGFQTWRIDSAQDRLAKANAQHAQQREAWSDASRASIEAERETERLRTMSRDKEIENVRTDAAHDASRADALSAAAGRLREHIARLATGPGESRSDSPATAGSAPATGPGLVYADLYRGVDDEAQELARAFDAGRRAGLACERIYDSLIR